MKDAPAEGTAGWGERTAAALIDLVVAFAIFLAGLVVGAIVLAAGGWGIAAGVTLMLAGAVTAAIYAPLMESRPGDANGVTLGKRAAGLRVVRNDGRPIGFWLAVLREFVLPILIGILITGGVFWLIDALWPLFDGHDRAVHDIVCETHVVSTGA